jgi:ribosomal protein L11 methylase PrmA
MTHPKLEYLSYPYEWTFSALKAAALLHLDFHIDLVGEGFTLSDATAYNIQFRGTKPVFIDHLSIVPYEEGALWAGQRQFCMQFLNPLLLWAKRGVAPNSWFRGSLEGISPEDLAPLLGFRDKLSFTVLAHVVAQSRLQHRAIEVGIAGQSRVTQGLSKRGLLGILSGLRDFVAGLRLRGDKSIWSEYEASNSYDEQDRAAKHAFVARMVCNAQPASLLDIGCNSGEYSQLALESGAQSVVGFDFDFGALERAFARFDKAGANVLPLWLDATNPSPSQGWAGAERKSMGERVSADAMIALAIIHHLTISRNVPLDMAVDWLVGLAPVGVIEFPTKEDVMVRELLSNRTDIFPSYVEEAFLSHVSARSRIVETARLPGGTRILVRYDRRGR